MPQHTQEQLEFFKTRHEQYERIILEHGLKDRAFYWIKEKQDEDDVDEYTIPEEWKPAQCFISIDVVSGNIWAIYFSTMANDRCDWYEDIILGSKIEIGEPPR